MPTNPNPCPLCSQEPSARRWIPCIAISIVVNLVLFGGVVLIVGTAQSGPAESIAADSPAVVWDSEILCTEAGYVQHGYCRSGAVVWRQATPPVPTPNIGTVAPAATADMADQPVSEIGILIDRRVSADMLRHEAACQHLTERQVIDLVGSVYGLWSSRCGRPAPVAAAAQPDLLEVTP